MKRPHKILDTSLGLFLAIFVVAALFVGYWLIVYFHYFRFNSSVAGTFGDMFGGINAFFTACTVILVFYAAKLQKHELDATRDEFKQQNETTKLQRFETTFFNLLALYNQIKKDLVIYQPLDDDPEFTTAIEGHFVFGRILDSLNNDFKIGNDQFEYSFVSKKYFTDKYNSSANRDMEIPHYYNLVMNTFAFIKDSQLDREKVKFYCRTFYTLLSPVEVTLLFYYVGLKGGLDDSLKSFIIEQGAFDRLYGESYFSHPSYWYINFPHQEKEG